jgi:hypothetical protein
VGSKKKTENIPTKRISKKKTQIQGGRPANGRSGTETFFHRRTGALRPTDFFFSAAGRKTEKNSSRGNMQQVHVENSFKKNALGSSRFLCAAPAPMAKNKQTPTETEISITKTRRFPTGLPVHFAARRVQTLHTAFDTQHLRGASKNKTDGAPRTSAIFGRPTYLSKTNWNFLVRFWAFLGEGS